MWFKDIIIDPQDLIASYSTASSRIAVFYSRDGLLKSALAGKLDFINLICGIFADAGIDCLLVDASTMSAPDEPIGDNFAIWMIEEPPSCAQNPNLFHAFPAYLHGFWYFDTEGLRNNSSISKATFKPHKMSGKWARHLFEKLHNKFVDNQMTKFEQPPAGVHLPPDGCIAIPVQTFVKPKFYKTYVQYPELIAETLRIRGDRPVAIKPHPGLGLRDSTYIMKLHDPEHGIYVAPYNLHELLHAASVVVTRCSAVAIEAALHKTPAIVSGQVDFHHIVTTVRNPSEIGPALTAAIGAHRPYEKYLTWFFTHHLFQPRNQDRTIAKLRDILCLS